MPVYTCEKCGETFQQKSHIDNHNARKKPCDKKRDLQQIIQAVVQTTKNELLVHLEQTVKTITMTERIVTKEQSVKLYENLHNLLWNDVGLSPAKSLEHMTFFFAFRMMEPQIDKINVLETNVSKKLPDICKWSNVLALTHDDSIFKAVQDATIGFRKNSITKQYFSMHEIKRAEDLSRIMKLIDRLDIKTMQETDTLGDIFEYMLSRGMSTMADQGQYFTDRVICNLAFKLALLIHPEIRRKDGTLCRFADFFAGTGGFVGTYVKGVSTLAKERGEVIDWMKEREHIYAIDKDLASVRLTLLNLLIQTGIPFSEKNIIERNSFQENIVIGKSLEIAPFMGETFDFEFMNPPYGGDKSKGKEYKFAYTRGKGADKKYLVNSEIQSIGIEDDNKVSAGVQLAMATLSSDGGVGSLVLHQGFFFGGSKNSVELRKRLAEECKIHFIVDIASGAFANTETKTSMIVFQKGVGPTEKVSFITLDEKLLVEVTLEELRAKKYSLNYKQYLPQMTVEVEGYEMVKLGDIAKKLSTRGKHSAKDTIDSGKYSLFSSSVNEIYKLNTFDYSETCCIVNSTNASGNAVVNLGREFSVTSDTFVFKCDNDLTTKYVQLYLSNNIQLVKDQFQGANHKHPTWDRLASITILLPSLERQAEIVEAIEGWTSLAQQEEIALKILEKQMIFQVKEMGRGKERMKLGEVCEFQRGKMITKKELIDGEFPVIGGGLSPMGYHTSSNRKEYTPLISQSGENAGHISRYTKPVWASDCFSISSTKIGDDFLYYSLLQIQDEINFLKTGTAQPHIYPSSIDSLMIAAPSLTDQQTLQSDFDEIRHKHTKIAEYKAKAQAAIQRLIPGAAPTEEATPVEEVEEEAPVAHEPLSNVLTILENTSMTRAELLEECKKKNLKGVSSKKREDLIKMLESS